VGFGAELLPGLNAVRAVGPHDPSFFFRRFNITSQHHSIAVTPGTHPGGSILALNGPQDPAAID
jgi:hypothetical protein